MTPAFSYTGTLKSIPDVEHIDVTFGQPAIVKVKAEQAYKTNTIRHKDVFIILKNGVPVAARDVGFNTKKFAQVVVKKTGKYKYTTKDSMRLNNKLKKKRSKKVVTNRIKLKKGDVLKFYNRGVNFEMYMEK